MPVNTSRILQNPLVLDSFGMCYIGMCALAQIPVLIFLPRFELELRVHLNYLQRTDCRS